MWHVCPIKKYYGKYTMKNFFEWLRGFKEGWDDVHDDASGQPEMQTTNTNAELWCTQIKA